MWGADFRKAFVFLAGRFSEQGYPWNLQDTWGIGAFKVRARVLV